MEFNLLGRFEVVRDGQAVTLRGGKPRALLAVLLLNANQPVSVERLVEALWGDHPPTSARQTVHYFVHRLRRALGPAEAESVLVTRPGGYLLQVGAEELDASRFELLLREARAARAAGDLATTIDRLDAAEALWRGPALADFAEAPFAQPEAARLEELRLSATEDRIETAVALGRHAEHITELEALIEASPLRERLRLLLILALRRAGRDAAATEAYEATRRRFADELGVEPGPELRRLGTLPPEPARSPDPQPAPARKVDGSADAPPADAPATMPADAPADGPAGLPQEERRLVTALVVGIAEPSVADLDPEDLRNRREAALTELHREIDRHGGALHTVIGGTALAVFGGARAREDDPERAVRASFALRELASQAGYGLRIGIGTGEAVVSSHVGAPGELPWTGGDLTPGITGTVVDTAAALQLAASPGGVLVSAATHRATERMIDYEQVCPQGTAWRPVAPRSRIGVAVEAPPEGPVTPLIERDQELELLRGLLDRVRGDLEPQLVTLIGAPGIGKTRLVRELGLLVEADPDLISWRQGRSLPYGEGGQGVTFWALAEVVKAHAGILDTDDAGTTEDKLRRAVAGALGESTDAPMVEAHLLPLVRPEPGAGQETTPVVVEQAMAARARFLEALATARPLVVVFEDLQWADERLLDFIEDLPERVGTGPLLVVTTARPELLERRPGWAGGKRNSITVSLTPLSEQGSAALLSTLLDAACPGGLPDELVELLLAKAGGNPLYLEEYVRMLGDIGFGGPGGGSRAAGDAERGEAGEGSREPVAATTLPAPPPPPPGKLPIPETVQQLITARIDTLPAADKALLTDLAVVGEQGWVGLLAALGGLDRDEVLAGLARLERRELLRRTRSASVAAEVEYIFRHTLIRDVAYGLLLRAERAAKHRQVAEWLAALSPDRMGDRAELLAHHLHLAVELARAADQPIGDLGVRACEALWSAGDRAYALGVFPVAARHYAEALRFCPDGDRRRPELLFRLGRARYVGEYGGRDELRAARDGFRAAGDVDRAARVEVLLGLHAIAAGRDADAAAHVTSALGHLAEDADQPTRSKVMALSTRAYLLLAREPNAEAFAAAEEALATAQAFGQPDLVASALCPIGTARLMLGDLRGADDLERGIAVLEQARKLLDAAQWSATLAIGLWSAGWLDRCAAVAAEGRRRAEAWKLPSLLPRFDSARSSLDWSAGRWDAVVAFAEDFQARWSASDAQRVVEPRARLNRAMVRLARGELDAALADVEFALDPARSYSALSPRQHGLAVRGRVLLAAGRRDEAAEALGQLLAGQRRRPATSSIMPDQVLLADDLGVRLAPDHLDGLVPGPWRDAAAAYVAGDRRRAAGLYEAMGALPAAAEARVRAARQLSAAGEAEAAAVELRSAAAFLRRAGAAAAWLRDGEAALERGPLPTQT